jgi:hypothetical protein
LRPPPLWHARESRTHLLSQFVHLGFLLSLKALTRRNVTDEFCVLHRSKAPPRAALCDVLMMAAFGQQRFPQVIFGFRLPPRKPGSVFLS